MIQITFEQLKNELFDAIVNQMDVVKTDISYDSKLSELGDSLDWAMYLSDRDNKYHIPYTTSIEDEQLAMRTIRDLILFYARHTGVTVPEQLAVQSTIDPSAYYKPAIKKSEPTDDAATLIKNAPDIVPTKTPEQPIHMVRYNNATIQFRKGGKILSLNDPKVSAILERIKQELEHLK